MFKASLRSSSFSILRQVSTKKPSPLSIDRKALVRSTMKFLDNLWKESPKVCNSVKNWAEQQDPTIAEVIYHKTIIPKSLVRHNPKTIEPRIPKIFQTSLVRTSHDRYLARISNAKVIGNEGVVILPDGSYTQEPAKCLEFLQSLPEYYSAFRHRFLKRRYLRGNYFSLMQKWSTTGNYFHTLRDNAHRIHDVLQYLPKDVIFLVPKTLKTWQYEILATYGVGKERILNVPTHEIWTVENLYFTPHGLSLDVGCQQAYEWGRQAFYDRHHIQATPAQQTELIYISRALTAWRRIVNEVEVEQLLARYGFQTYLPERLNIGEQVALFSKAKAVVSVTGAALANLMFSQPGTHVLEISTIEHDPVFGPYHCEETWSTCEDMGHCYSFFHGDCVDRPDSIRQDIFIPLDKLELSIQNLLASLEMTERSTQRPTKKQPIVSV